jgi:SGF29 tudor-like domain
MNRELRGLEQAYLAKLSKNKSFQDKNMLQKIEKLRSRIRVRMVEKTSISRSMLSELDRFVRKLDTDLAFFESDLNNVGDLLEQAKKGFEPGSDVAFKPTPASEDYILGRVIFYNVETDTYDIADADETSSKRYHVGEKFVVLLDLDYNPAHKKLAKGEAVMAVYPETTSFYPATVVQAPRKAPLGTEPTVVVQFNGDQDENGVTPHRTIPVRQVFRVPGTA